MSMRRFSQRSYLVTLSEINITPLLDLAFVLLIIFVITTPLLEQGLELKLPQGGKPDRPLRKEDFRTVEVSARGFYLLDDRRLTLPQIQQMLARDFRGNPNLAVFIRADKGTPFDDVFQVTDMCANLGIKVSFRSEPRENKR
jgi:biopolymer transport protein ExbD